VVLPLLLIAGACAGGVWIAFSGFCASAAA